MWLWRRKDEELREEIDAHLRLEIAERIANGQSPSDAADAASRAFGNRTLVEEAVRSQWGWEWLHSLWQDSVFGMRNLRRYPVFAAASVTTLAAGIGAATVMFSVLYGVLFSPFPYRDAGRLVLLSVFDRQNPGEAGRRRTLTTEETREYASATGLFEGIVTSEPRWSMLVYDGFERPAIVVAVSPNLFSFVGIPASLGRPLRESDGSAGAPPAAVISEGAWRRLYGGDPALIGRSVILDRKPYTVAGVIPKRYAWFNGDFWIPGEPERAGAPARIERYVTARLRPGVSITQVNRELTAIGLRLARVYPDRYPKQLEVRGVYCIDDLVGGPFRRTLYMLAAAVLLLLLIGCSNVANLQLSRAAARSAEIAMRISLGAGTLRILRQLLVESSILGCAAGLLGCGLAVAGLRGLEAVLPRGVFANESVVEINLPVLLFGLLLSGATVLLFGFAPAWQLATRSHFDSLRGLEKDSGDRGRFLWLSEAFVSVQVAFAVVLTVGAGLLMRSFLDVTRAGLPPKPAHIGAALPIPGLGRPVAEAAVRSMRDQFTRRIQALPGVLAAGWTTALPGMRGFETVFVEIATLGGVRRLPSLVARSTSGMASAAGYSLLAGRWLQDEDSLHAQKVAVINETLARAAFPGQEALFRIVRLPGANGKLEAYSIVGVIADVSNNGLREAVRPMLHLPLTEGSSGWVVFRTDGNSEQVLLQLPKVLGSITPSFILVDPETLENKLEAEFGPLRFATTVLSVFAVLGLVVLVAGLHGAISYSVSRRTYELGIRKAMGARLSDIVQTVLARGVRTVVIGVVAGLLASATASRALASLLGSAPTQDPRTYALVLAVIALAAVLGMAGPAAKAALLDPVRSLRKD